MSSSGDKQERFLALYLPCRIRLDRFVAALEGDRERAREIVAETVTIAYERFESLRHPEAFLSYLFTIARRVANAARREAGRMNRVDASALEHILDPATPPDVLADIRALHAALALLPRKQAEAVVLFELLGLSMKEIRDIQGGTLVSVKVRISRGRRTLARILGVDEKPRREASRRKAEPAHDRGIGHDDDAEQTPHSYALPGNP